MNKSNKIFFSVGIIGPVFYFFLLSALGFMWKGYNPLFQSMSEIGSVVSPYKNIMNYLGFSLFGLATVLFGIGLLKEFGRGVLQYVTFLLILTAGVFMFAIGLFPCDAGCVDITPTSKIHSITSTVPAITLPLAAMVMSIIFAKRWSNKWGHMSFWLGALAMGSGPVMFIPFIAPYLGIVQRVGMGLSLLWMLVISVKAYKTLK